MRFVEVPQTWVVCGIELVHVHGQRLLAFFSTGRGWWQGFEPTRIGYVAVGKRHPTLREALVVNWELELEPTSEGR